MNKKLLSSLLLLSSSSAFAIDTIKWDYISAEYQNAELGEFDFDGFALSGSKLIKENIFIEGQYSSLNNDNDVTSPFGRINIDRDLNQLSLGLGYRHGLSSSTDIFTVVSYEKVENKYSYSAHYNNATKNSNGYSLKAGIRSLITSNVELSANIQHIDVGSDTDSKIKLAATYHCTEQFSVGISYVTLDDLEKLAIGASYYF